MTRMYVNTPLFSGWATVIEYFPNEIYPIQVRLDQPDEHGHVIKRVCKEDIANEPTR